MTRPLPKGGRRHYLRGASDESQAPPPVGGPAHISNRTENSSMAEVTEAAVLAALKAIDDPDRGGNIVDLGMVSGLALRAGHVAFAIEVDRARAARLEGLRHQAEKAVSALPGVLSVSAVLTAERPASADQAPQGQRHAHAH